MEYQSRGLSRHCLHLLKGLYCLLDLRLQTWLNLAIAIYVTITPWEAVAGGKYGTELVDDWEWDYLFIDPEYTSLVESLSRPQAQDKLILGCIYDFATWGG